MTVEENVNIVKQTEDSFNTQDWDRFVNLHAESVVVKSPNLDKPIRGREALLEFAKGYYATFPDLSMKIERMIGQGDWVVTEELVTGTNTGPLTSPTGEEIPPTNKPIRMNQAFVFRVDNGFVQEVHIYFDQMGMMTQLGLASSE